MKRRRTSGFVSPGTTLASVHFDAYHSMAAVCAVYTPRVFWSESVTSARIYSKTLIWSPGSHPPPPSLNVSCTHGIILIPYFEYRSSTGALIGACLAVGYTPASIVKFSHFTIRLLSCRFSPCHSLFWPFNSNNRVFFFHEDIFCVHIIYLSLVFHPTHSSTCLNHLSLYSYCRT